MSRHSSPLSKKIQHNLAQYEIKHGVLAGLTSAAVRECFVKQLVDSVRRVEFVERIPSLKVNPDRSNPSKALFDPLRAAAIAHKNGDVNEAIWLTFLAVHFGKHASDGWSLSRLVYLGSGSGHFWDWKNISINTSEFKLWLDANKPELSKFRFSNHRRREHLDAFGQTGTGAVIESFVEFVKSNGSLPGLVRQVHIEVGQQPDVVFEKLYSLMEEVRRFGRLGKFDFLTMLGKLGILPITPGQAYIWDGATGPFIGSKLLFFGQKDAKVKRTVLDSMLITFDDSMCVGMQPLEDAICNWQKSPSTYKYFRG